MSRVAVITDVHANLAALEATLTEIDRLGIDAVYCGGDLVGYGPQPNEVCALIEQRAIPTIYGNYDYAIGRDVEDCGCAYIDKHDREIGQLSVDWTLAHTSQRSKHFMRELPFDLRFELAGKEPSDGLEPSTPSLPCALIGNPSQPTATVLACWSRSRGTPICHRLPLVATALLHKRSIRWRP
jgi:hypothetical protein